MHMSELVSISYLQMELSKYTPLSDILRYWFFIVAFEMILYNFNDESFYQLPSPAV
jgi:hypothetical protein